MSRALEMMERCHDRLAEETERLQASAEEAEACLEFFARTLRRHFADEEESVFPRLGAEHAELVQALTADHREHEALLERMRAAVAAGEPLDEITAAWAQALAAHTAREERELLPLVAAFDPEIQKVLTSEMEGRRGGGRGQGRRRR